jgi:hypothetical protein
LHDHSNECRYSNHNQCPENNPDHCQSSRSLSLH